MYIPIETHSETGILGLVSVIAFGGLSKSRYWAYEWQFHRLSWAFGLATAGSVLLHIAGIFFLVEAGCQFKHRRRAVEGRYSFSTNQPPSMNVKTKA